MLLRFVADNCYGLIARNVSQLPHNKSLNRSGGWERNLKSMSLAAARLARTLSGSRIATVMNLQLKYHRDAAHLLPKVPQFSQSAANTIREREHELGTAFPDSVREWYSLDRAVSVIQRYSNDDWIPIKQLDVPFKDWYGAGPKNFVAENLLLFLHENQGVCNWAIKLDGTPDPAVVVEVDTAPNAVWLPCADRFSTFIWCQIWDHLSTNLVGVAAQEIELSSTDLEFLMSNFDQLPTTKGWPGHNNHRFKNRYGTILIWDDEYRGVDWFVSARSHSDLATLLCSIWHCGGLSQSLYDIHGDAADVLDQMRGGHHPTAR
jgi:hypothetical protein